MVNLRPHILKWNAPSTPAGETPEGYPIPETPGLAKEIPCRFHLGSNGATKTFKNEDSTVVNQVGTIRCDAGEIPEVGGKVEVVDKESGYVHFDGIIRAVFKGQLSHRLEV